ncbi:hypothetical protein [Bacillus subtilis]|uniref:hypothetical protein n=1 Tax=Bacillus subtilis TaxID=1423 RepID=UPI00084A2841|nr:hypothetical protein [Bacillus subtilis]ODV48170.1 hypothetical protein BCM26_04275 [Bacillus subtilis]OJH64127.1 hypothetical protein BOH71_07270 [Bacillus subtilis]
MENLSPDMTNMGFNKILFNSVKEIWNQTVMVLDKDINATPFVFYNKKDRVHQFESGNTADSYGKLLSLADWDTMEKDSLVISPHLLEAYYKEYQKSKDDFYIKLDLFLLLRKDLMVRTRLVNLIEFEKCEDKSKFPHAEYPILVRIFDLNKNIA